MRAIVVPLIVQLCMLGPAQVQGKSEETIGSDGLWAELRALRHTTEQMDKELSLAKAELQHTKNQVVQLTEENSAVVSRLTATESEVERLKELADRPQVAFSASLGITGHHGPFNTITTVVYKNIFTNTGNYYNNVTGVFTAPLRGTYHFSFTIGDFLRSTVMGLTLVKNGESVMHVGEWGDHQQYRYASNSVIIELEARDVVFMQLPKDYRLYDDSHNRNTFSGFLLYPM